jgi:hypothetical protein
VRAVARLPDHSRRAADAENRVTPRLFIAATRQNEGKTTVSLGLVNALRRRFARIGYIKPVGQRFVDVNGLKIDEDSVLIDDTYHVNTPLDAMSPIAVEQNFTRDFDSERDLEGLERKIVRAFDRASWEKDFVVIEGSGHAGVGSVFGLSNARVAQLLDSKAIIVVRGGIGAPFDEVAINRALFDKFRVEVIGVILNKVLPNKLDFVREAAGRHFERAGLPLLGVLPRQPILSRPTLNQIAHAVPCRWYQGENFKRRRIDEVVVGAVASRRGLDVHPQNSLLIAPAEREDLLIAALLNVVVNRRDSGMAGVLLSGGQEPSGNLRSVLSHVGMPVLIAEADTYTVASAVSEMTVKTESGDGEKIALIQQMVEEHVDIPHILEAIGAGV